MGKTEITANSLISVERILPLRFPSIKAKTKKCEIFSLDDLDMEKPSSPTVVISSEMKEDGFRRCKFIESEQLISVINEHKDVKKEKKPEVSAKKLEEIHIVGEELYNYAKSLAEKVTAVKKDTPEKIAKQIKDADAVLWLADLWGRVTAPAVSVILDTGLCADCTRITTDGESITMYRPTFSGSLTAGISCKTKPAMATVRADTGSSGVIISLGRGAATLFSRVKKLPFEIGASRAAVDSGLIPYEYQIGQTGKRVSPSVYVALGISGQIQHTCAIDASGIIVAVNTEKDAEIFEYADYGIISDGEAVVKLLEDEYGL